MTSTINSTLVAAIVMLCLAGVLISGLALGEHYNTQPSPCSINDKWDCGIVNHSPYATLLGIPVAFVGIFGYAMISALAGRMPRTTAILAFLALLFSLRLTWIEWKVLGVWCIYCLSSQVIIAMVFLLTLLAAALSRRRARPIE
ncbi:MAG: vitamin K epoxide reductase [Acidobacteria bacterium]|nr:MAG: vitamin K epoxide reductase [Acidobacteriota bacterium]